MIATSEEYKELQNAVKDSNDRYVSQLFEDYQFTDKNELSKTLIILNMMTIIMTNRIFIL